LLSGIVAAVLLITGCAGGQTPSGSPSAAGDAPPSSAPRVLTIGESREPADLFAPSGGKGETGIGIIGALAHDKLTQIDAFGAQHPGLVLEVPSPDKGTWMLNADGSMDLTWKIKPGVKWHDGTPFTAEDMLFTLALNKDPELISDNPAVARVMESATAPDPHTFIVHWSRVDVQAANPRALTPLPRHILEASYTSDSKEGFLNHPHFREKFVGLGPYRLVEWVQGSHIEATRFEDYHMGRPPLDRVIVRYIFDPNTIVANVLAGSLDVVVPKSVETDAALQLRRQWEGTGNLVRIEAIPRIIYLEMMMRPEYAKPANGLPNLTVRQALYHAIDRQGIADAATGGLGPAADSWYNPSDPLRAQLEAFIDKYPYDPSRAQQLLAQAGWTRGADGVLANAGQRFETEVWVNPQAIGPAGAVVTDNWKAAGVDAGLHNVPLARAQDRGYISQRPGPLATDAGTEWTGLTDRYVSRDLASAANNWAGRNRAGYANPRADELFDLLNVTIDSSTRLSFLQEQVKIFTSEVATMPLYWMIGNAIQVKGVKADIHPNAGGFRVYLWSKE
jgi:peptide/nickel transport system substrate-binding protein